MIEAFAETDILSDCDVCVVGAGPVGIALALACEDQGLCVLLLESGLEQPEGFSAALTGGHAVNADRHAMPDVAICRGLGGTSRWWGGRCVPYDDIDFAHRPSVPQAAWPLSHDDIRPWYTTAAAFFGIGPARFFAPAARWKKLQGARFDQLERWTPEKNAAVRHHARLESSTRVRVLLGATVTRIELGDGRVTGLVLANAAKTLRIAPRRVVLACGGLETTRLLLATQKLNPQAFGGADGPLGRGYMGHISGKIADLILSDPALVADHDFYLDDGAFVRRRFTFPTETSLRENLLNIAFWIDNPPFHRAEHRSGVLSLVWFALAVPAIGRRLVSEGIRLIHVGPRPYRWLGHVRNILLSPIETAANIVGILRARFLSSPRKPGFQVRNSSGHYALHYHAEQAPLPASAVRLSRRNDALGLPFLDVNLQFGDVDAQSVLRAHELLDAALRQAGLGRLEFYESSAPLRLSSILRQAGDGYHQIGTARMSAVPAEGIVDPDCRVHGVENLFVASSAIFPSSGQANSTFLAVALAQRLAAHLGQETVAGS